MKKRLGVALLAVVITAVAAPAAYASFGARGAARAERATTCTAEPAATAATPLTASEAADLAFMREEEKLAHDVYVLFAEKYELRAFTNIAGSESRHTAAVKQLLDRYGVADPAATTAPGAFTDPELQELYDRLVAHGEDSLSAALSAAIAIEKADIADLQARLGTTTHDDVGSVYANLLRASQNHLRAFERLLDRFGG
jgi:hypothetical protein